MNKLPDSEAPELPTLIRREPLSLLFYPQQNEPFSEAWSPRTRAGLMCEGRGKEVPSALRLRGAVQLAERPPCVFEAWSPRLRFQRQGCAVGVGQRVVHSRFPSFRRRVIVQVPERRIWARPTHMPVI